MEHSMATLPSPTRSTFSSSSCEESSSSSSSKQTRRTSRFVEGDANTLQDMQSLRLDNYNAIMAEMDSYESSLGTKAQPTPNSYSTMSLGRKFGTRHRRGGSNMSESNVLSLKNASPPAPSGLGVEMWARRSLDVIRDGEESVGDKIKKGLGRLSVAPSRRSGIKVEGYAGT